MTKREARKHFLNKRKQLTEVEISTFSDQIFTHWKNSFLSSFSSYHIFLSIHEKKEIDTFPLLHFLWSHHKKVYCSKVYKEILLHYELTPQTELRKNSWGIPEPVNQKNIVIQRINCIFIPLLAYDISGNRVGYGKGYYDRFLKDFPNSRKVGLSFFPPVNRIEDTFTSDILLDYIITPSYFSGFPMDVK